MRFVGHSLGGSVATLLSLMLVGRGAVLPQDLLPAYTFGAASVLCDGDCEGPCSSGDCGGVLQALGLPRSSVRNVVMHLDIVPRAFTCDYRPVQALLRRLPAFAGHPCLRGDAPQMYTPVGVNLVMQPTASQADAHPLLPTGPGLYELTDLPFWAHGLDAVARPVGGGSVGDARGALTALLNAPHPLAMLSDPASYGPRG